MTRSAVAVPPCWKLRLMGRPSIGVVFLKQRRRRVLSASAKTGTYSPDDIERATQFSCNVRPQIWQRSGQESDLIPKNENFLYWFSVPVLERLSAIKRHLVLSAGGAATDAFFWRCVLLDYCFACRTRIATRAMRRSNALFGPRMSILLSLESWRTSSDAYSSVGSDQDSKVAFLCLCIKADSARRADLSPSLPSLLIVTSPPYLNAYDYHKVNTIDNDSIGLMGDVALARDIEIGTHDEFTRPGAKPDAYFEDIRMLVSQSGAAGCYALKANAPSSYAIGDAIVSKKPVRGAGHFYRSDETAGHVFFEKALD